MQRAAIRDSEGRVDEAIADYRNALAQERRFPNARTLAWREFALLVVKRRIRELYDEVFAVVSEHADEALFPIDRFAIEAVQSLIAADRGDQGSAQGHASAALAIASETHSGFRYHSTLGLVGDSEPDIMQRLRGIGLANHSPDPMPGAVTPRAGHEGAPAAGHGSS
jgi:hypothetical protein